MKNVTVETRLTINLTADDWQLFTSMDGAEKAAYAMNKDIEFQINVAMNPAQAYAWCSQVLDNYSNYGASDTEPRGVLEGLISLRFPGQWN